MSCNLPIQKNIKNPLDCKCYNSVMRAYRELLGAGQPKLVALEAATMVYSYHHPEDSKHDQALTVERWINQNSLH